MNSYEELNRLERKNKLLVEFLVPIFLIFIGIVLSYFGYSWFLIFIPVGVIVLVVSLIINIKGRKENE